MSWTKGFKAFNRIEGRTDAGKCRGFLFEEGRTYEIDGELELCKNGFHACKNAVLCLEYYPTATLFAEIEFLGDCLYEQPTEHKGCSSKIRIIRFFGIEELFLDSSGNSGKSNSGYYNSGSYNSGDRNSGSSNSGDYNSGDRNSGSWNSWYRNSGDRNSGSYNSGGWNSGDRNSGYYNSGDYNSGDRNSGYYNSGSWNACNREGGYFNTEDATQIRVFNKLCDLSVWNKTPKPELIHFQLDVGLGYKGSWQKSYKAASKEDKELLLALPNFDKDVFFELTGIDVEKD